MTEIERIAGKIAAEARRGAMSLDTAAYAEADRDPTQPILLGGSPGARLAFLARDLGRDEVLLGEPLIGDAGQRVRRALYRAVFDRDPPPQDRQLEDAVRHALLTNTVPYKPVGNKSYPNRVRERFRPYIAELLTCVWKGDCIITLGTEAFMWFAPYAERGALMTFWRGSGRYEEELHITLSASCGTDTARRDVVLAPLPHPSPLNQAYLALFPKLLEQRLSAHPPT